MEHKAVSVVLELESLNFPVVANQSDPEERTIGTESNFVTRDLTGGFRAKYGFDLGNNFLFDVDGVKPLFEYFEGESTNSDRGTIGVESAQVPTSAAPVSEIAQRLQVVDELHLMGLLSDSERASKRAEIIAQI